MSSKNLYDLYLLLTRSLNDWLDDPRGPATSSPSPWLLAKLAYSDRAARAPGDPRRSLPQSPQSVPERGGIASIGFSRRSALGRQAGPPLTGLQSCLLLVRWPDLACESQSSTRYVPVGVSLRFAMNARAPLAAMAGTTRPVPTGAFRRFRSLSAIRVCATRNVGPGSVTGDCHQRAQTRSRHLQNQAAKRPRMRAGQGAT